MTTFKNLRVLIYSNPLVVNKISKQFIYWKDSGFLYSKELIKSLPRDFRFYWIIPDKIKDHEWFLEASDNVEVISYPYSTSIHQNRYEYYGEVLRKNFPYTKDVDIIINNQPETSMNMRVWAENQRREKPLIYNFYHWLDTPESAKFGTELSGYVWRQLDGYIASDLSFVHGEWAEKDLMASFTNLGVQVDSSKFRSFYPNPIDRGYLPIDLPEKKIIMFNHRLNNTTQWKEVIETCASLNRDDFVLWITDQEQASMYKQFIDRFPFIHVQHIPTESYGYVIENSHVAVCNHKGYSTWNMAILDTLHDGCFTLVPKDSVYLKMFGNDSVLFHDGNLKERINACLNADKWKLREYALSVSRYYVEHSVASVIKQHFLQHTSNITPPKKYDNVLSYILENGSASKKDWVNEFWSFHVNSNFQKMRWLLLQNGIEDDTSNTYTVYKS